MILRGRGRSAVADAPFRPRESQVRTRAQVIGRRGRRPRTAAVNRLRVRASSARPTPGDGDAGGDDQADGRAPARGRRRPPRRWVRVRPAAPLDPDRRQRLGTPGRRSTSKRRDCRSGRGGRAVRLAVRGNRARSGVNSLVLAAFHGAPPPRFLAGRSRPSRLLRTCIGASAWYVPARAVEPGAESARQLRGAVWIQ